MLGAHPSARPLTRAACPACAPHGICVSSINATGWCECFPGYQGAPRLGCGLCSDTAREHGCRWACRCTVLRVRGPPRVRERLLLDAVRGAPGASSGAAADDLRPVVLPLHVRRRHLPLGARRDGVAPAQVARAEEHALDDGRRAVEGAQESVVRAARRSCAACLLTAARPPAHARSASKKSRKAAVPPQPGRASATSKSSKSSKVHVEMVATPASRVATALDDAAGASAKASPGDWRPARMPMEAVRAGPAATAAAAVNSAAVSSATTPARGGRRSADGSALGELVSQRRPSDALTALTASTGSPPSHGGARPPGPGHLVHSLSNFSGVQSLQTSRDSGHLRYGGSRRRLHDAVRRQRSGRSLASSVRSGVSDLSFEDRHEPHARGRGRMGRRRTSSVGDILDFFGMSDGVIAPPTRFDLKALVKRDSAGGGGGGGESTRPRRDEARREDPRRDGPSREEPSRAEPRRDGPRRRPES